MQNFNSYDLKRRPDQAMYQLNQLLGRMQTQQFQLVVQSTDGKQQIVIGQQPKPNNGKFGVYLYNVKGDRLEEVKSLM